YVKGNIIEALAAYDKAAAAAKASSKMSQEFELRYKAALIEQQEKHFASASGRFERLATELKSHDNAAGAHLLACWNKAQQARSEPAAGSAYAQLLQEHLARWPDGKTSDQVHLWLGNWQEARREFAKAFDSYAGVTAASPDYTQAVARAADSARQTLST